MHHSIIAIALSEDGSIASHAGRALHWKVYRVEKDTSKLAWNLQLNEDACLHEWHTAMVGETHPLHLADIAIAGSAGEGVVKRLAEQNTVLLTTAEKNVDAALSAFMRGELAKEQQNIHTGCSNQH